MSGAMGGVEAIVFDLGGTVLEIRHDALAAILARHDVAPAAGWERAAERLGRARMEAAFAAAASRDEVWRTFFEGMMESAGTREEARAGVFEDVVRFHREHHLWGREFAGMGDAVLALRAGGYRTAVISNSDGRAPEVLERLGLLARFELVIDSHEVGVEKPAPGIFRLACERLGLPPERCAYVGDVMAFDVLGARAAGLVPVLFDAYGSYDDVPAGIARASGPAELLALFPGRAALAPRAQGAA
ncbi:MAG: HAD family hydrolase [Candidatus Eisenbacteria bacterium]